MCLNELLFASLYPDIIHQYNIGHNTMIGKLIFDDPIDPMENKFNNDIFNRSRWFIEDLVSGDYLDFCQRYMGLPSYEFMVDMIRTYFTEVENPGRGLRYVDPSTGRKELYQLVDNSKKRVLYELVDNSKPYRVEPIVALDRRPKDE